GDGEAVVDPLAGVGYLARLVQPHQPGGEHLRVDPVVTAIALGQQGGDGVGDVPDAGLQGDAVVDEAGGEPGDRPLHVGGRGVGEVDRVAVAGDQDVDLVEVQAMRVVGLDPEGARELGVGLDDQQPVGI